MKKLIACALCLVMLIAIVPLAASASESEVTPSMRYNATERFDHIQIIHGNVVTVETYENGELVSTEEVAVLVKDATVTVTDEGRTTTYKYNGVSNGIYIERNVTKGTVITMECDLVTPEGEVVVENVTMSWDEDDFFAAFIVCPDYRTAEGGLHLTIGGTYVVEIETEEPTEETEPVEDPTEESEPVEEPTEETEPVEEPTEETTAPSEETEPVEDPTEASDATEPTEEVVDDNPKTADNAMMIPVMIVAFASLVCFGAMVLVNAKKY